MRVTDVYCETPLMFMKIGKSGALHFLNGNISYNITTENISNTLLKINH
jgi:hypothetical protein